MLLPVAQTMLRKRTDMSELLPSLIKLFAFSSEFHSTNMNLLETQPRAALPEIPTQQRPYKAIVVLFFEGGADSFSMLIPVSGCVRDLYAEYADVRSNIALTPAQILPMLPVESTYNGGNATNPQPCTTFGTHPSLSLVQELWDAGQVSWFANIGSLVEPITIENFNTKNKDGRPTRLPPSLFGHDTQQRQCQSVHADSTGAKGVLGRMMEALTTQALPYRCNVVSMYLSCNK